MHTVSIHSFACSTSGQKLSIRWSCLLAGLIGWIDYLPGQALANSGLSNSELAPVFGRRTPTLFNSGD